MRRFAHAEVVWRAVRRQADPARGVAVHRGRGHVGHRRRDPGHARGPRAVALRPVPGPGPAPGPDYRAAGHARGHHRPVHAAAVRRRWSSCSSICLAGSSTAASATITIAHITFTMAYVTVVVQSRLASFDDSLEEAALDLGARPAKVFFRITVPLILPAILSGWLLAFTLSWDDLVVTQFVSGPGSNTLPMVIFSRVRLGVSPVVNALATIMVLIVALGRCSFGGSHAPAGTASQTRGTDGRHRLTTAKLPPSTI